MMKPLDLAKKYMNTFYGNASLDELHNICHPKLVFDGPFYRCNSVGAYIASLKKDPPREMSYQLIHSYEDDTSACLIYQFTKGQISTPMAQYFDTRDGKISRIFLIFDGRMFEDNR